MEATATVLNGNEQEEKALAARVNEHQAFAMALEIKDEAGLHGAGEYLLGVKGLIKEVEDFFAPMVEAAHKAHKAICDKRATVKNPLVEAEKVLKSKIGDFQMELDRKREEEDRKAREKADKEAEKEREKLLKKAEKAEAQGDTEKANELVNAASEVYVAPTPVVTAAIKPAGISTRYEFVPEVYDKRAVPDDYKSVDLAALKRVGNATKDAPPTIAGVRWLKRPVVSGRVGASRS